MTALGASEPFHRSFLSNTRVFSRYERYVSQSFGIIACGTCFSHYCSLHFGIRRDRDRGDVMRFHRRDFNGCLDDLVLALGALQTFFCCTHVCTAFDAEFHNIQSRELSRYSLSMPVLALEGY